MVIRILVEGGAIKSDPTLSATANNMIAQNSAQLRQALHEFFVKLLEHEDVNIKVTIAGGNKIGYKQFVEKQMEDVYYTDLDRKPSKRDDWFDAMEADGIMATPELKEKVFFWIQEMEAWFLKYPQSITDWISSEGILLKSGNNIAEDEYMKIQTPEQVENLQQKPSRIMQTLFQRYLLSPQNGKDGKPRKLRYGKLRHAPRIIPFLSPKDILRKDGELKRFYAFAIDAKRED